MIITCKIEADYANTNVKRYFWFDLIERDSAETQLPHFLP